MNMRRKLVIGVIAMREVEFFIAVAVELKKTDPSLDVSFVSFFQPGNALIRERGFTCFDLYEELNGHRAPSESQLRALESRYDIDNLHRLLVHEKLTHDRYDDDVLLAKFSSYLERLDAILGEVSHGGPAQDVIVIQELGGFVAPLSLYYAARRHGMTHVFFEPSFFKGRLHYVINGLDACQPGAAAVSREARAAVHEYLNRARNQRAPVVPAKDRHHFRDMGLAKIFNRTNAAKLCRKLWYRQRGLRQEYEHAWKYARRSVHMLASRMRNKRLYAEFDESSRAANYVYFPFHVQLDYALTVRSLEYLDQLSLVRYLADILPGQCQLYVKEHPASVGGFGHRAFRELLHTRRNIQVMHPRVNSYDIIENAKLVVTINSKVGAEALMLGKRVIVLGDAFYSASALVQRVNRLADLDVVVRSVLEHGRGPTSDDVEEFFGQVWKDSHAGELYVMERQNVQAFAQSLTDFMGKAAGILPATHMSRSR
jgi:hypothetical protein